jgi:hypothetical protein
MSADKPKFREFWLKRWKDDKFNFNSTEFCKVDPRSLLGIDVEDFAGAIHVIEYSALTELQDKFSKYWDKTDLEINELMKALQAEREAAEILLDALKYYARAIPMDTIVFDDGDLIERSVAIDAIKEYRKERTNSLQEGKL